MKGLLVLVASFAAANALNNLNINKITVQVGPDGTDDHITVKICDRSKCCHTNKLSHLFSSEWVKNELEVWDGRKLGNCSTILFDTEAAGLEVEVHKRIDKQDTLDVTSIVLEGAPTTSARDTIKFTCGSYLFGKADTEKTRYCLSNKGPVAPTNRPLALTNLKIDKVSVQVGADGTKDDVFIKICDGSKCCHSKELSHLLSREWVANRLETWDGGKLGNCSNILFDSGAPDLDVYVIKTTKKQDTLEVTNIVIEGAPTTDTRNIIRFYCGSYKFGKSDSEKSRHCLTNSPAATTARTSFTKRRTEITKRPTTTTRTTKRPTTAIKRPTTTTKRPVITSNENLKLSNIVVQIGDDGTDDDVSMKICHDKDNKCCETGNLDGGILSDDWSRNDKESWKNKDLGICKHLHWDGCKGLTVTLKKKASEDTLTVSNINVELTDKNNATKTEKFTCRSYVFLPKDREKKNTCVLDKGTSLKCRLPSNTITVIPSGTTRRTGVTTRKTIRRTGVTTRETTRRTGVTTRRTGVTSKSTTIPRVTIKPLFPNKEHILIKKFEVEVGKDGTRDPVIIKICAGRTCCITPALTKLPISNSWRRNTNESWVSSDLGECRDMSLPSSFRTTVTNLQETRLTVTVNRKGRDGLKLRNLNVVAQTTAGAIRRFKCGNIVVSDEKASKECFWRGIAPISGGTGPCLRSGRNCATTKPTTTRPPFLSGK